jgi:hypothetical protein
MILITDALYAALQEGLADAIDGQLRVGQLATLAKRLRLAALEAVQADIDFDEGEIPALCRLQAN